MTTKFNAQIRWGLILFPDTTGNRCLQDGPVAVKLGDGNEAAIQKLLTDALKNSDPQFPDGPCTTPIDTAIDQTSKQPELKDTTRDNFAVLITDGAQFCSGNGGDKFTEMKLQEMANAGIKTFVLGFGSGVDAAQLDKFAIAGGAPRAGMPRYYQANNATELEMALNVIAGSVVGCTYKLDKKPEDPSQVFVFFDDQSVAREMTNGWSYDEKTGELVFHGTSCDQLKSKSVKDVDVVFGCNMPSPN